MKRRRFDAHVPAQLDLPQARVERDVVGVRIDRRDVGAGDERREPTRERRAEREEGADPDYGAGLGPDSDEGVDGLAGGRVVAAGVAWPAVGSGLTRGSPPAGRKSPLAKSI